MSSKEEELSSTTSGKKDGKNPVEENVREQDSQNEGNPEPIAINQDERHAESADSPEVASQPSITHKLPKPVLAAKDLKRKDGPDATSTETSLLSALLLSELPWWTSEDEIRGWCAAVDCEQHLQGLSFHEHKVTGKCKGQAFLSFSTPVAASSVKQYVHTLHNEFSVEFSDSKANPFRPQAKDSHSNKRSSTKHNSMMPPPPNLTKNQRAHRGHYENMTYSSAVGYNPQAFAQLLGPAPVNFGYRMPNGHIAMNQGRGTHNRGSTSRRGGSTLPIIPPTWVQPQMVYGAPSGMLPPAQPVYATDPVMFQQPGYLPPEPDPLHGHKRVRQQ